MSHSHPSADALSAFSLGALPPDEAAAIEQHVSECDPCCETMLGLAVDDTFLDLVQRAGDPAATRSDEAAVPTSDEVPPPLVEHARYDVVRLIGRGGMGDVYEARHRLMNRMVALKVINREFISRPEVVERFRREVETAAQLSHPNIVTAHDAEQAGDVHFLVMEYVDGTDLARVVKDRGPLPVEEACDDVRQAALGLDAAHRLGLIHRDIKPHNLMVTADDTVKVLDFGLASLVAGSRATDSEPGRSDLTSAGTVMGTPDFISPEQAADARNADARSDVYSLGATLYFLLAGRPLFTEGDVVQKLRSHAEEEPEPLDSVRDGLPEGLATVVSRMLAKDPDERFQTAAEVAVALEPFGRELKKANVSEVSAQPPRRRGPFSRMTAFAAGFATLLVAAAVYFIVTNNGVVRIEVLDDSLQVRIDGREVTLSEDGKHVQTFRAGDHEIAVLLGETELITDEFELKRNGEVRFRVSVEEGQVVVSRKGEPPRTADLPGGRNTDPVAEEWSRLAGRWRGVVGTENGQRIEMPFELVVDAGERTMTLGNVVAANGAKLSRQVGKPATAAVELDPTSARKRMTATFPEDGRGKMFGIYELGEVELTLSLSADGFPHASTIEEGFGQGNGSRYEFVRVTSRDDIPLVFDVRDGEPVVEIDGRPVGDYRTYLNMMVTANPGIVIRMDIGPGFDPQLGSHLLDFASVVEAATFPPREAKTELSPAASAVAEEHHDRVNNLNRRVGNLRRVGMAFHVLHASEDRFPFGRPEDHPEWFDEDGRPHLSWRVHVLPALGLDELHEKFRLDQPWDSPHNKPLLAEMPDLYKTNGDATKTSVQLVVGPGTVYDGKGGMRLEDVSPQTALLVDAGTERAAPWTKPQDLPFDAKDPIRAFGKSAFGDEQHVLMVDGATKFVPRDTDPEQLRRLFLRGDGKPLDLTKKRTTPLPTAVDDREAIQGVWKVVSSVGQGAPANVDDSIVPRFVFTADEAKRILGDDISTRTYRIDATTSPKRIDLLPEEQGHPDERGIYELDGDTLRMAFPRGGERPESFEVKPGNDTTVLVLERVRGDAVDPLRSHGHWSSKPSQVFEGHHDQPVRSLATSPDGELLASASQLKVFVRKTSNGDVVTEIDRSKGSVVFHPEGKLLAAVNLSGVSLWEVPTGKKLRTFEADIHPFQACYGVAFSPDGRRLAVGSEDGLKVWDVESGRELHSINAHLHDGSITDVAFSPDGTKIASANPGGGIAFPGKTVEAPNEVKVWDAETGKRVATLSGGGYGVAFSPDGRRIASGNYFDGTATVWDIATEKELHRLRGHEHGVSEVAFSPDGQWLATAGRDNLVKVWDSRTGREVANLPGHELAVLDVVFSPDGKRLYSSSDDKTIRVWEFSVRDEKPVSDRRHDDHEAIRGTWRIEPTNGRPPEEQVLVGLEKGLVFGEKTVRPVEANDEPPGSYRLDPTKSPKQIDIVVGEDTLLGIYELDGDTLRLGFSDENGKRPTSFARSSRLLTLKWRPRNAGDRAGVPGVDPSIRLGTAPFRFGQRIDSLEYSRDGKRLITSGSGWGTAVWDAESGDLIRHVPEEGKYLSASLSPDGTLMATSAWNARTVTVRTVESGEVVCSIDGGFRAVRFSPDGTSVFTVVGNRVARFDIATGERLPAFAGVGGGSSTFAVSPTGTLVAGIASPRKMHVWDWKEAKEVASARSLRMGQGNAKDIVFTPDGKSLVLLGEKNTGAELRDARTLEVTKEFPGDERNDSTCVNVSADGSRMVFGTEGGLVFVYDRKTGELVKSWRAHTSHIAAVALSPDGRELACGTHRSGSVRIWNVDTQKPTFATDNRDGVVGEIAVLSDGKTLIAENDLHRFDRWNLANGERTHSWWWTGVQRHHVKWALCSKTGRTLSGYLSLSLNTDPLAPEPTVNVFETANPPNKGKTIRAVALSDDGRFGAAATADDRVCVCDLLDSTHVRTFTLPNVPQIDFGTHARVALSADGGLLAGSSRNEVRLWDVKTGRELTSPTVGEDVTHLVFSPDGARLALAGRSQVVVHDVRGGRTVTTIADDIGPIAFSPDGLLLATGGHEDSHFVKLWETNSGREVRQVRGALGGATSIAFSPDGGFLYAGTGSSLIVGWDLSKTTSDDDEPREPGEVVPAVDTDRYFPTPFRLHGRVHALEYSADGKQLLASGSHWGAALFDAESGDVLLQMPKEGMHVTADFSPDAKRIALAEYHAGDLPIWDVKSGKEVTTLPLARRVARFSSDGKLLFTVSAESLLTVYDLETGKTIDFEGDRTFGPAMIATSPRDTLVAAVTREGKLRVWDWRTKKRLAEIEGAAVGVHNCKEIVFTPDGKSLVVLGGKSATELRDARTLELKRSFTTERDSFSLAVSGNGERLAIGCEFGHVVVFDLRTGERIHTRKVRNDYVAAVALSPCRPTDGTSPVAASSSVEFTFSTSRGSPSRPTTQVAAAQMPPSRSCVVCSTSPLRRASTSRTRTSGSATTRPWCSSGRTANTF